MSSAMDPSFLRLLSFSSTLKVMSYLASGLAAANVAFSIWMYMECKGDCCGAMPVFIPAAWAVGVRLTISVGMVIKPLAKFDEVRLGQEEFMIETLDFHRFRLTKLALLQATSCLVAVCALMIANMEYGTCPWIDIYRIFYAVTMAFDALLAAWAAYRDWMAITDLVSISQRVRHNHEDKVRKVCSQMRSFQFRGAGLLGQGHSDITTTSLICDGDGYCQDPLHSSLHFQPWFLQQTTCTICLDTFNSGDAVLHPVCGHLFHSACFEEWTLRGFANQSADSASLLDPSCLFGCSKTNPSAQLLGTGGPSYPSADLDSGGALDLPQSDDVFPDSNVTATDSSTESLPVTMSL
ncbi:unnamed protein product [Polarella glacialis]|uniref:RING-type domain-containing protein n=2 Tax=Polarella glacialis TaxID=89957 RepID=A0A813GHW6_POLGL|nr:unnamed protein product [Polarella glacialis]